MSMSGIPDGLGSVTASMVVSPCGEAIDWYVKALGAVERGERLMGPDGLVAHAEMTIGNTVVMLGDEWPDGPTSSPRTAGTTTVSLFIYTDDVDTLWQRALDAGAEVVFPLELQFYGHKGGRIRDPYGHSWGLAQQVEVVSDEEMARRLAEMME